jgi:hypothetical protein
LALLKKQQIKILSALLLKLKNEKKVMKTWVESDLLKNIFAKLKLWSRHLHKLSKILKGPFDEGRSFMSWSDLCWPW